MTLGNGTTLSQRQQLAQRQVLSALQIQSLHILTLDNQALSEYLRETALENPLVEHVPGEISSLSRPHARTLGDAAGWRHEGREEAEEAPYGGDVPAPSGASLRDHLLSQLNWQRYDGQTWRLINRLIACLDEDGYLPYGPEELSGFTGESVSDVETCLSHLKTLGPPGLFARCLPDFLLDQLSAQGEVNPVLERLIRHHLPDLAAKRFPLLCKTLGLSATQLKACIQRIAALRPRPLEGLFAPRAQYPVPDLLLAWADGRWAVELNDAWMGEYRFSAGYLSMMDGAEPGLSKYLTERFRSGQALQRAVRQRRDTLLAVAGALCRVQEEHLLGARAPRPLSLADVAAETGLHPSTVSRAVADKTLQCPRGLLPLKGLLAGSSRPGPASPTAMPPRGEAASAAQVKQALRSLVALEAEKVPLSDAALARALAAQGLAVSRRTVAKYRQALDIPDSYRRGYT